MVELYNKDLLTVNLSTLLTLPSHWSQSIIASGRSSMRVMWDVFARLDKYISEIDIEWRCVAVRPQKALAQLVDVVARDVLEGEVRVIFELRNRYLRQNVLHAVRHYYAGSISRRCPSISFSSSQFAISSVKGCTWWTFLFFRSSPFLFRIQDENEITNAFFLKKNLLTMNVLRVFQFLRFLEGFHLLRTCPCWILTGLCVWLWQCLCLCRLEACVVLGFNASSVFFRIQFLVLLEFGLLLLFGRRCCCI